MSEILIIHDKDADWETPPPEWLAKQKPGNPGLRFKRLMPHAPGRPNVQRTQYLPGHREAPHSHPEDEVICVTGGEIHFGREVLRPGDTIFVPRDKVYSLHTRDTGAEFLRIGLSDLAPPAAGPDAA
jgi:quercetin dioxygenase-like cupin family protein